MSEQEPTPTEALNPRNMLLSQDYAAQVVVKKEVIKVPIKKPHRQEWVITHPDPENRVNVAIVEDKETRDVYIVAPEMQDALLEEWVPKILILCQTRGGSPFFWAIKLPDADGRIDTWNESAMQIACDYSGQWIRVKSNREIGAYDVFKYGGEIDEPKWEWNLDDLLSKAFRNNIIKSTDHPFVRSLNGED